MSYDNELFINVLDGALAVRKWRNDCVLVWHGGHTIDLWMTDNGQWDVLARIPFAADVPEPTVEDALRVMDDNETITSFLNEGQ